MNNKGVDPLDQDQGTFAPTGIFFLKFNGSLQVVPNF